MIMISEIFGTKFLREFVAFIFLPHDFLKVKGVDEKTKLLFQGIIGPQKQIVWLLHQTPIVKNSV